MNNGLAKVTCNHKLIMNMAEQKWLVFTSENISIVIPNEFMKMLEIAWKIKEKWAFLWNGNGMKKWFINISDDEKWLIFMIENSLKMDDKKSFINMIGFWKWLMKISENGKPIINTSEIFFWDYDMKNHDIHENKNVCPEFNGEKMHEQNYHSKNKLS